MEKELQEAIEEFYAGQWQTDQQIGADLIRSLGLTAEEVESLIRKVTYKPQHSGAKQRCCGEFRCEPCHFVHLLRCHPRAVARFRMRNPGPLGGTWSEIQEEKKEKSRKTKTTDKRLEDFGVLEDFNEVQLEELYLKLREMGHNT